MVYFSSSIRFALVENGQYDLLKMITGFRTLATKTRLPHGARCGFRRTGTLL